LSQAFQAKIVQNEGYDMHDFDIFDDRAALLWRKPYVDGAVRELTAGNDKSVEQLRRTVESMILDRQARVLAAGHPSPRSRKNLKIKVTHDAEQEILADVRRHPEEYRAN